MSKSDDAVNSLTEEALWDYIRPLFEHMPTNPHLAIVGNNAKQHMIDDWGIPEENFYLREDGLWDLKVSKKKQTS